MQVRSTLPDCADTKLLEALGFRLHTTNEKIWKLHKCHHAHFDTFFLQCANQEKICKREMFNSIFVLIRFPVCLN
jgi:hypothetical protein